MCCAHFLDSQKTPFGLNAKKQPASSMQMMPLIADAPALSPREEVARWLICEKRNFSVMPAAFCYPGIKGCTTCANKAHMGVMAHRAVNRLLDEDMRAYGARGTKWLELLRAGAIKQGGGKKFYHSFEDSRALFLTMLVALRKPEAEYTDEERRIMGVKNTRPADLLPDEWRMIKRLRQKDPRDVQNSDFALCGIEELRHNFGAVYKCVSSLVPEENIMPWEMKFKPYDYFEENPSQRVAAIRWLAEVRLKKDPRKLVQRDFKKNRLGGLLADYYSNSPYEAVCSAYPELNLGIEERKSATRAPSFPRKKPLRLPDEEIIKKAGHFMRIMMDALSPLAKNSAICVSIGCGSYGGLLWEPPPAVGPEAARKISIEIEFEAQTGTYFLNGRQVRFDIRSNRHQLYSPECLLPVLAEMCGALKQSA